MKRIAAVIAGASLLAAGAYADDVKTDAKSEVKTEGHRDADGTGHVKTTKKHKHGNVTDKTTSEHKVSKDMSGGTTEEKDTVSDHDAPGTEHDRKVEKKETIKRDAKGNVVKHEKTDDVK